MRVQCWHVVQKRNGLNSHGKPLKREFSPLGNRLVVHPVRINEWKTKIAGDRLMSNLPTGNSQSVCQVWIRLKGGFCTLIRAQ